MSSMLETRSGRITAAVICLAVGLPAVFWIAKTVIPHYEEEAEPLRVDIRLFEMGTRDRVPEAMVRVYRRTGGRDMPETSAVNTFDGTALFRLRAGLRDNENAYLHVDAKGFKPYREPLRALIDGAELLAGDRVINVLLEPDREPEPK